tara:strand:- start:165 stop:464 length:300 start_codon:yes stop_codon:yes gene_type:complete
MTKEKTKEEKTQDSSLSPEPSQPTLPFNPDEIKPTNMYSRGSHGGIDDEYYINEIIGLDDFTYDDWIGDKRLNKKQREEKRKDEYFTNSLGVRMWKGQK